MSNYDQWHKQQWRDPDPACMHRDILEILDTLGIEGLTMEQNEKLFAICNDRADQITKEADEGDKPQHVCGLTCPACEAAALAAKGEG